MAEYLPSARKPLADLVANHPAADEDFCQALVSEEHHDLVFSEKFSPDPATVQFCDYFVTAAGAAGPGEPEETSSGGPHHLAEHQENVDGTRVNIFSSGSGLIFQLINPNVVRKLGHSTKVKIGQAEEAIEKYLPKN